eukprot:CAMPEP_0205818326 /NCGR_PEP_ID=MMETSP0206-20130828/214_1 /ASSEMBLY_ACC=CAM_ASM_000279 /TAXON_ID=36767 /ORGANISM="Euplotes focardii, Strain TN1" /LENGTH=123 /DNA_ID=CAMNT_0053110605 /DNA_START=284 /DNA_END=655 /DNA_ORIENTATION=+
MTLIFYLFILSPENIDTVRTASFVVGAAQLGVSAYLIYTNIQTYKHPEDPDTLENLWGLLMSAVHALELLVFIVMIVNFFVVLFNTKQPAQKRLATPQYAYYYTPQTLNKEELNVNLVAFPQA